MPFPFVLSPCRLRSARRLRGHLGFGGGRDFIGEDVEYLRFEPTFIVAIGEFGNGPSIGGARVSALVHYFFD